MALVNLEMNEDSLAENESLSGGARNHPNAPESPEAITQSELAPYITRENACRDHLCDYGMQTNSDANNNFTTYIMMTTSVDPENPPNVLPLPQHGPDGRNRNPTGFGGHDGNPTGKGGFAKGDGREEARGKGKKRPRCSACGRNHEEGNDATCRKNQREAARLRAAGLPAWQPKKPGPPRKQRKREGDGSMVNFLIPKFHDDDERCPGMGGYFGHFHFDKGGPGGGGGFGLGA